MTVPRVRSLLFTPGNKPQMLAKVFGYGADAVVLDLEDAVPNAEKAAARPLVAAAVAERPATSRSRVIVRVNGPEAGLMREDLAAAVQPGVFAIFITKLASVADVAAFDEEIGLLEERRGMPAGEMRLICSADSAHLVLNLPDLARSSPRLLTYVVGGYDFAHDLGVRVSDTMVESLWARSYSVLVARDAGLAPPIHTAVGDFRDIERSRRILTQARELGFQGANCLHPSHVELIHSIFGPTPDELRWAERVIAAFAGAEQAGVGTLEVDGHFVDYAVVKGAEEIVRLAGDATAAE